MLRIASASLAGEERTGMTQGRPPISGRTRVYGIFADPIDHVQTPAVFNTFFDERVMF